MPIQYYYAVSFVSVQCLSSACAARQKNRRRSVTRAFTTILCRRIRGDRRENGGDPERAVGDDMAARRGDTSVSADMRRTRKFQK